jgi:hypothetical protein
MNATRLLLLLSLPALCLALLTGCASGPPRTEKVALVIGNAAYDNVVKLVNPTNDAADMCASLK